MSESFTAGISTEDSEDKNFVHKAEIDRKDNFPLVSLEFRIGNFDHRIAALNVQGVGDPLGIQKHLGLV